MWRWLEGDRSGACRKVRLRDADVVAERAEGRRGWRYSDRAGRALLVQCGSAHACPHCARRRSLDDGARVRTLLAQHLASCPAHDAWLLTLTLPHAPELAMADQVDRLQAAWRELTEHRVWRAWRKRWGVRSVLRAWDETMGERGLHGHWHVLLLVDYAVIGDQWLRGWSPDDRRDHLAELADVEELREAWLDVAVSLELVDDGNRRAFEAHGLDLRGGEQGAQYVTRWGLDAELAGAGRKSGSHFALLDHPDDELARARYLEYVDATRGLPVLTGLAAACKRYGVDDDAVEQHLETMRELDEQRGDDDDQVEELAPIRVVIKSYRYHAALAVGWYAVERAAELAAGAGDDPQAAVDELLARARPPPRARGRPPPRPAATS